MKLRPEFTERPKGPSPWNPVRQALGRVQDYLPAPAECPFCQAPVGIYPNSVLYGGRLYGGWPWAYVCRNLDCNASIGIHKGTAIPLGTMADKATKEARSAAHKAFDPVWVALPQGRVRQEGRKIAYTRLATLLDIPVEKCHIGMFDVITCRRVVQLMGDNKCMQKDTPTTNSPTSGKSDSGRPPW